MNKRRLLKLAELLEKDARRKKGVKFDMHKWGIVKDVKKPLSCGTQACALGLAALSGAFKRAGLGYILKEVPGYHYISITQYGRERDEFRIASGLFDITRDEAIHLFTGLNEGAVAEKAKAKQIRDFVKTGILK